MFIEGFKCYSCSSTLGKWMKGGKVSYCFTCCATKVKEIPLMEHEVEGLSGAEVNEIVSREYGVNSDIYPRLNVPYVDFSLLHQRAYLQSGLTTFVLPSYASEREVREALMVLREIENERNTSSSDMEDTNISEDSSLKSVGKQEGEGVL